VLGRTPLIERRDERFVVRERNEIERLLKKAFPQHTAVDRLMPGLATVASALNASDACPARIAAVHLKIPDLPSLGARRGMEIEDRLIKSVGLESRSSSSHRDAAESWLVRADRRFGRRCANPNRAKRRRSSPFGRIFECQ
jgi:hypothetical protein